MVGLPASGVWRPILCLQPCYSLSVIALQNIRTSSVCRVGPTNVIPVGSSGLSQFLLYNLLGIMVTSARVILKINWASVQLDLHYPGLTVPLRDCT